MAVIYSYPTAASSSLSSSDLLLLSKMDANGRPTKSVTLSSLATFIGNSSALGGPFLPLTAGDTVPLTGDLYMAPDGAGPSTGSKSLIFRGIDDVGPGTELDGAKIFTTDSAINPRGQDLYFQTADDNGVLRTGLFIDAFQQVAVAKGTATAQLDVGGNGNFDTTLAVGTTLTVGTDVTFSSYGAGTQTGTATFNLEVDANGNVIETASGGATFTAANSEATPHIVLGADAQAKAPAGGADGVYICASSFGSATSNDEQINIGRNNDTNGTQSVAIGIDNSATVNSPYGLMIGKNNTTTGTRTWAIGEGNNMGTSDTVTFGKNNISSFTGGVSSGGLMNLSVGDANEVDCDKAIVVGWNNDLSGSFGWTLGGGKEVVVIGTRFSNTLLGPNRSATDRTGPRVIIGTGSLLGGGGEEKRNSVEYYQPEATHSGIYNPALYNSASYADDVAAAAGGVGLGELYRNGSVVQIRMT